MKPLIKKNLMIRINEAMIRLFRNIHCSMTKLYYLFYPSMTGVYAFNFALFGLLFNRVFIILHYSEKIVE